MKYLSIWKKESLVICCHPVTLFESSLHVLHPQLILHLYKCDFETIYCYNTVWYLWLSNTQTNNPHAFYISVHKLDNELFVMKIWNYNNYMVNRKIGNAVISISLWWNISMSLWWKKPFTPSTSQWAYTSRCSSVANVHVLLYVAFSLLLFSSFPKQSLPEWMSHSFTPVW